jgi:hypothetical protein
MSAVRLLAACAAAAALLTAAPVAAQSVLCCMIIVDVKGNWIGMSRDCAGALAKAGPELLKQACKSLVGCEEAANFCTMCDPEAIERLKGRMRGLNEASKAHQKGWRDAQAKRSDARDRLWGKGEGLKFEGGSIADFGKAGLDSILLASGGGGGVGKVYSKVTGNYNKVRDWSEKGWALGSDPLELENWSGLGKDMLEMQADDIFRRRSTEALRAAREHFKKTGNYAGAQNVYRQKWGNYGRLKDFKGKADNFADALNKLWNLYEKTDKMANDLQDWIDAYRDDKAAEREKNKIDDEMARIQKELDRLNAACGIKPGAGPAQASAAPQFLEGPPAAAASPAGLPGLTVAAPPPQSAKPAADLTLERAQSALRQVRTLQKSLRALDQSLGRQLAAPLSPWLAGVSREAEPRLLLELVKASRTPFSQLELTLSELSRTGTETWQALQAIPPDRGR